MNASIVVARKEIASGLRDVRAVISSGFYSLIGPAVVSLVSLAPHQDAKSSLSVLAGVMSVFTLVSAFAGGMNIAMDTVAGERERGSLLPLLLNPVSRMEITIGKWLGIGFFSAAGLLLNLLAFAALFPFTGWHAIACLVLAILPISLLAAVQLLISTACRGVKETQAYLSLIMFLPMGLGMFLVFVPGAPHGCLRYLPLAGQQMQMEQLARGGMGPLTEPALLGWATVAMAALFMLAAAKRLECDEAVCCN